MDEMIAFFHMGGYAFYVWTSYAVTLVVLGGVVVWSTLELRQVRTRTLQRARTTRVKRT